MLSGGEGPGPSETELSARLHLESRGGDARVLGLCESNEILALSLAQPGPQLALYEDACSWYKPVL